MMLIKIVQNVRETDSAEGIIRMESDKMFMWSTKGAQIQKNAQNNQISVSANTSK